MIRPDDRSRPRSRLRRLLLVVPAVALLSCAPAGLTADAAARGPVIGAWYFTRWHPGAIADQVRKGGSTDPWQGVREYAAGHGAVPVIDKATGRPVDFSGREPQAGFYDLEQPGAVDTQLSEGARAGLSFFAFYFYIDGNTGLPFPISSVVQAFYDAPNRHGMSLLVAPIVNPNGGPKLTLQRFRANLLPILTEYLASPAALRINDRPVLVDWALQPAAPADYPQFYDDIREAVRGRTGRNPFIIHMLAAGTPDAAIAYNVAKLRPDAFTCFEFPTTPAQDYAGWAAGFLTQMRREQAAADGTPFIPCASTGQDMRPWFGVGWKGRTMDQRGYTVGSTPASYRDTLLATREFMRQGGDPMQLAILYAWNEWGEAAASIEPSRTLGYAYADQLRTVFPRLAGAAR